ncbi:DUF3606 domain-containing protein [Myxococcus llanfairpwllgwyngyllgogerychwyrndrobwllllantysiliogogogochensis]|uniref:DUF3606 domain-containing protein n=1 Tax=Myxococcus llanfairpwllgwyngyllgogerychwyrndrobwllllantysiliogogogochensis TaxID=2590453 RepID=A0A540WSP4_9BACT|nr:DUF3606 domain-containing protein [Myxococcus llanfairpwllgwyngyllgogerychwyrndrobwllllantysiliogogogochensis]TQF12013.1 DUF3606 domain-containing protein [Myxococcus llanfairpwllgwyngyllgogerychwyrndrobwllllantysiliogogogochensis]
MADDPKKRGTPDNDLISIKQEHEIRSWCAAFGCSREELLAAVAAVGHSAAKVRDYLNKNKNKK